MTMGKFNKIGLQFERNFLSKLKEDENACVEIHRCEHHVTLHPFHLNDFNKSIKEILNNGIAKYHKHLGGILLGYEKIKLLSDLGNINFDSCFIHLNIEADFFVFKPEIGKELHGVVNKISADHVACLVHNAFNISIPKPVGAKNWLGSSVQIGHEILFKIIFLDLEGKLPYIRGEISSILSESDSGISTGEECNVSKGKKNRITKFEQEDEDDSVPSKKKSKGLKRPLEDSIEDTPKIKKKKIKNIPAEEEASIEVDKKENKKNKKQKPISGKDELTNLLLQQQMSILSDGKKLKKKHKEKEIREELNPSDELHSELLQEQIGGILPETPNIKKKKAKSKKENTDKSSEIDVNNRDNQNIGSDTDKKHKNKKKHKEKHKSEEISLSELNIPELFSSDNFTNKSKVSTPKPSDNLIDSIRDDLLKKQIEMLQSEKPKKKKKKSKTEKNDEISIPDISISNLFNSSSVDLSKMKKSTMADSTDKFSKSSPITPTRLSWNNKNMPHFSELEASLGTKAEETPKKRKHSRKRSISDSMDYETPKKKIKTDVIESESST